MKKSNSLCFLGIVLLGLVWAGSSPFTCSLHMLPDKPHTGTVGRKLQENKHPTAPYCTNHKSSSHAKTLIASSLNQRLSCKTKSTHSESFQKISGLYAETDSHPLSPALCSLTIFSFANFPSRKPPKQLKMEETQPLTPLVSSPF